MSEDLKTIKELADELSVTKQNIQYHYQRLPKELQLKSSNGSNLINSKAEKIIFQIFVIFLHPNETFCIFLLSNKCKQQTQKNKSLFTKHPPCQISPKN